MHGLRFDYLYLFLCHRNKHMPTYKLRGQSTNALVLISYNKRHALSLSN